MNTRIRKAVGAIITYNNEYLLVHKVKIMNSLQGTVNIPGIWDFPKGGMKASETAMEAILRELREETGSQHYRIIKQCDEKIEVDFDEATRQLTGYEQQEITMFTGEFLGVLTDLQPQDEEIDDICFLPCEKVIEYLSHDESRKFFQKLFSC